MCWDDVLGSTMATHQSDEDGLRQDAADALRTFTAGRLLPKAEATPHLKGLLESRIDELSRRLAETRARMPRA